MNPIAPEVSAELSGVELSDLVRATHVLANGRKGMLATSTGPSMGPSGNVAEHLAVGINTVCGRWARGGDRVFPAAVLGRP